jgi:5-methylthioadenosine/S-adenosylhomocysteine deaminase
VLISSQNRYKPFAGSVGIESGRIAFIGEKKPRPSASRVVDADGKILMPGLVNGHCHGDMTLARGMGDDMTLLEQQNAFDGHNWFYEYMTDDDRYFSRLLTYCEALLSGTTFILENMFWSLGERSQEAMVRSGIRGALAEDIRPNFLRPDELLIDEDLDEFRLRCGANGITPVIGSIAEEDFTPDRLTAIRKKIDRFGLLKTCHMAETTWRRDAVREKFDTTPVRMLAGHGMLNGLIASHAVHIDDGEISLLAEAGSRVVNTPLCEMKIADGTAPRSEERRVGKEC